jgi:hypothetical protein
LSHRNSNHPFSFRTTRRVFIVKPIRNDIADADIRPSDRLHNDFVGFSQ